MLRRLSGAGLVAIIVIAAFLIVTAAESFRFAPDPAADSVFIARAQHVAAPGLKVSISALGPEESRRSFGAPLASHGIQPIWLAIENDTDEEMFYRPIATDHDYFSPYEVSFRTHGFFSFAANNERDAFFLARQIPGKIPPRSRITGFVYSQLDAGIKATKVWITGKDRNQTFDFTLEVPGPAFLGGKTRLEDIYPGRVIPEVDLPTLRTNLAKAPCCTENASATKRGDPLNLVVIESDAGLETPFIRQGWHLTQKLDAASMLETVRAFLFAAPYMTSPVSPLYLFGRREDLALQKARSTINERIHLRLWLAPEKIAGRRVWIGQVSRDIGVRLTDKAWNLTTHKIGPDVDFDRSYLLQDLLLSGFVERYGYVDGVGAATMQAPRTNLTGDPYFTDGQRLVIVLGSKAKPRIETQPSLWLDNVLPAP
ncbi:MAG: LssY C-terminal domain-containing protein [Methylocystis sp.]|nr:LssY C-terminal domain-containing protein [Methylocystis sp.]MCA3583032.1 LssY C-terminal domain-containing protein [Methylocystis sp.]MCA3588890.1 LssY C-terminal domain-containing protein [Methylocystis sp.]MCA3590437.1 LssY C-terminal domain-containing protein [Methylocystis sp.]